MWVFRRVVFESLIDTMLFPKAYSSSHLANMQLQYSFRRIQRFTSEYSTSVFTQYESERTGMRVVTIDQKGPEVQGHFVLATEIHDDSGAPHTLEHLCFMGSRNYQYPTFLRKLSERAYSGINAWTSTDHTAYTLDTAGWESFALVLPVYLEHVIAPTLTDASCYTEVYHVDGTGHDAGVVYSEMQGLQNDASSLIDFRSRRLLYPEGVGFRYETGGMMEQLRVLSPERIREFHREMYQPRNLCLVITGEIDHENLLTVLDKFEDTILDIIPSLDTPFKRPWVDSPQVPPLERSTIERVEFPEEDESYGEVEIRFLGPDYRDRVQAGALNVVLLYLSGSSASLLDNILVEKEQVVSAIYYSIEDGPCTELSFTLSGVATEQLEVVERRFFELLQDAMKQEIDLKYMQECIHRHQRTWKFAIENSPTPFAKLVITDFLFGKRDGSTLQTVGTLEEYKVLEKWTDIEWRNFIRKWISDAHHVSILGVPSAKLATNLTEDEQKRMEHRKKKLGEEGLRNLAEALEKAKTENGMEAPKELLSSFVIPGTDSIHFIQTTTAKSGPALKLGRPDNDIQQLIDSNGPELPLFIHFEHIPSNFVQFTLIISTADVPLQVLPLLPVYIEAFFSLPIERNGRTIAFEQVIVELEKDTVGHYIHPSYTSPESLSITFQMEVDKYQAAILWLKELAWNSVFKAERLVAIATKLFSGIPDEKRSGEDMLDAIHLMVQRGQNSISRAHTAFVKARYLKRVKKLLTDKPEEIISHMEDIRNGLFRPENFRVLVIADLEKLANPVSSWATFVDGLDTSKQLKPIIKVAERLSDAGKNPGRHAYVVPMKTIDSSYADTSAKGLDAYDHPKLPALLVAIAYMNSSEGPLWVAIRGPGLAYDGCLRNDIDSGLIHFMLYRSPNAHKAFEAAKQIVEGLLSESIMADSEMVLESAVSSIVSRFAAEQHTHYEAAHDNFIKEVIHGVPSDYNKTILKKIRAVNMGQVKEVLRDIIMPLFTPGKADLFVTCAPALEENISRGFKLAGFKPETRTFRDFEDDYGLKLDGDESDKEDNDDEGSEEEEEEEEEDDDDDDDERGEDMI
ncbi:cytoplasm protein [Arthroderma uncinatum]|uniref:cytoplasm protein n=1 Tax=Arthroderma uncinatum TaxID=74035 RepID=UPI00144AB45F|nr:cytoplasm protein [Arthroderma uncinatum]KAF3481641.1 cytoplasm protein [Arthroderma uncinatum]